MKTPTAKELFVALWQARMGLQYDDGPMEVGPGDVWSPEYEPKWVRAWNACVDLSKAIDAEERVAMDEEAARELAAVEAHARKVDK